MNGVNIHLAQRLAEEEKKSKDEPVKILNQCTVENHALAFIDMKSTATHTVVQVYLI